MPQLSELIEKKKFIKKEYRPWNLSGDGTVDGKDKSNVTSEKTDVYLDIEKGSIKEEKSIINEQAITPTTALDVKERSSLMGNDLGNKQVTNEQQTDNLKVTIQQQLDNNKVSFREQRDNGLGNIIDNKETLAYLIDTIKKLSGIQKNIFYFIINVCSARNALDTGNILSSDIAFTANCTIGSAKTSLIRLIEKRIVVRLEGKASRGGHMVLGITKEIQAAAIQAQQALFNPLKLTRTDNIMGNITNNASLYSSSISKNNITTTSLPEEWERINFTLLQHIGFCETQIRQLHASNMTTPSIVQDAINRFAYSLEYNDKVKIYSDPLNVLMGVLRKGQRWNEPNYVEPKELALRQMVEEGRKRKEQQDALLKELIDMEFPAWRNKLTQDDIKKIISSDTLRTNLPLAITAELRTYFIDNVLLPKIS